MNRLIKNNVKTLVDVRRNPLSRKFGFSKRMLSETVKKLGIGYVHIPESGIASERRQELNTQADYDRLFNSYERQELKQTEMRFRICSASSLKTNALRLPVSRRMSACVTEGGSRKQCPPSQAGSTTSITSEVL